MAGELFGDVTRDPRRLGWRRSCTLPLSILTHGAAIVAALAIPIVATDELPEIRRTIAFDDIDITPVVPPPPMRRAAAARAGQAPRPPAEAAPIEAPPAIAPEPALPLLPEIGEPDGDPRGVPGGLFAPGSGVSALPAQPAPTVNGPVRISRGIAPPRRIVEITPVYPPIAQSAHIEGTVVIDAIIGPSGDVQSARVIRSVPLLDQAALAAVRQWKYTPALLNGAPVSVILTVSVEFRLAR